MVISLPSSLPHFFYPCNYLPHFSFCHHQCQNHIYHSNTAIVITLGWPPDTKGHQPRRVSMKRFGPNSLYQSSIFLLRTSLMRGSDVRWEHGWGLTPSRDEIAFYQRNQQKSIRKGNFLIGNIIEVWWHASSTWCYLHFRFQRALGCTAIWLDQARRVSMLM